MIIKGILEECLTDYKKIAMYIAMPFCSFKCDKENGCNLCQNSKIINEPDIEIKIEDLIKKYDNNPLTKAIILSGLEPFDSLDIEEFIEEFRKNHYDDIVIYTGYTEEEILESSSWIFKYQNIIIKFGRFRPNQESHFDEVLGVKLISPNQYAKRFN